MPEKRELAVVLISAGMDSAVCASIASLDHELAFLHFQYGQKAARKELECFFKLVEYFNPREFLVVDLFFFKRIEGSSLISEKMDLPETSEGGIPSTYVPFRNGVFLSMATAWAEVIGAKKIYIGVNQVDFSGYPDCTSKFIEAFNQAIDLGTKPETKIRIETPIINLTKKEIVLTGVKLKTPFHLTWSCYRGEKLACGKCESCKIRIKAFKEAGIEDPLPYATLRV